MPARPADKAERPVPFVNHLYGYWTHTNFLMIHHLVPLIFDIWIHSQQIIFFPHRYHNPGDAAVVGRMWKQSPKERLPSSPMDMTSQKASKENLNWWLLMRNHHFF